VGSEASKLYHARILPHSYLHVATGAELQHISGSIANKKLSKGPRNKNFKSVGFKIFTEVVNPLQRTNTIDIYTVTFKLQN
jgi:hypothetical protein